MTDSDDGEPVRDASAVKTEIDRLQSMINSGPMQRMRQQARDTHSYVRPKNAASIILVRGKPGKEEIVMGKRNKALKFMPGALVFPGGSVDRSDGAIVPADDLHPETSNKLMNHMRGKPTPRRARSLAVAALRELAEETGLLIGRPGGPLPRHQDWQEFANAGIAPTLSPLRLMARAITPPGSPRRFDTWFFAMRLGEDHVAPPEGLRSSGELEDLQWISPEDAMHHETREITRVMLVELMQRLKSDPLLSPETPAPAYVTARNRFKRKLM